LSSEAVTGEGDLLDTREFFEDIRELSGILSPPLSVEQEKDCIEDANEFVLREGVEVRGVGDADAGLRDWERASEDTYEKACFDQVWDGAKSDEVVVVVLLEGETCEGIPDGVE
jgi:hypothetical protein